MTAAGQAAARDWLYRPVAHGRDVRSELLPKLALLDRAGADPEDLLRAQLAVFGPIAAALEERTWTASGFEHILTLWRHKEMQATMQFLHDELTPGEKPGSAHQAHGSGKHQSVPWSGQPPQH